jgi:hypothetical protein
VRQADPWEQRGGQESVRYLEDDLRRSGIDPHIIGGAAFAVELDPSAPSSRAPS